MYFIKDLFAGFCIGLANIIPGVSGGTFALILGLFERLMNIPNRITVKTGKEFIHCFKGDIKSNLDKFMRENDLDFFCRIVLGIAIAIATLSGLMSYLIANHFSATYSFFFGLILISITVPWKIIKKHNFSTILSLIAGVALVVGLAASNKPEEKIVKKSLLVQQSTQQVESPDTSSIGASECVMMFACGAISISAMILPGLSGSLVLLVLGQYSILLTAIYSVVKFSFSLDQLLLLAMFGLGIVGGLLIFSRFVKFILANYHDQTVSLLTGLVTGSLFALWPFKADIILTNIYEKVDGNVVIIAEKTVKTATNILPTANYFIPLITFICGCGVMVLFVKRENSK